MAITYPLALPSTSGAKQISFTARSVVGSTRSPFSGKQKIYEWPGQWFEASISLPPLPRAEAEEWVAFLLSLKGKKGTFLLGDPQGTAPRGSAAVTPGTPLVNGAGQTGGSLAIDGLPVSVSNYLRMGDWVQLGTGGASQIYKNLENVNTNGSGEAILSLWPNLRSAPADNAPITLTNVTGLFRLSSNAAEWDVDETLRYGLSFAAEEVL